MGSQAALLHTDELWLQPLAGDRPDVAGQVAVVADRTKGVGKDRMLHWEISVLDPFQHDALAELEPDGAASVQQNLAQELTAVLARQRCPEGAQRMDAVTRSIKARGRDPAAGRVGQSTVTS